MKKLYLLFMATLLCVILSGAPFAFGQDEGEDESLDLIKRRDIANKVTQLMRAVERGDKTPDEIIDIIAEMGKPAVPLLRTFLRSTVLSKRVVASFALVKIGDPIVIDDFIKIVQAQLINYKGSKRFMEDYDMRSFAATVLADRLNSPNKELTEMALERDYDKIVRILRQEAISIPQLIVRLKKEDERKLALKRLETIVPAERGKGIKIKIEKDDNGKETRTPEMDWDKCYDDWRDWWKANCRHYRVDLRFRLTIIRIIGQLRIKAAIPDLVAILDDHIDFPVPQNDLDKSDIAIAEELSLINRLAVISALSNIPDHRRLKYIINALADRAAPVRKAVINFLRDERISGHDDLIIAVALAENSDIDLRVVALEYLAELGECKKAKRLMPLVDSNDCVIRNNAILTLGKLRCKEIVPKLQALLLAQDFKHSGNNGDNSLKSVLSSNIVYSLMNILDSPKDLRSLKDYSNIEAAIWRLALSPAIATEVLESGTPDEVADAAHYLAKTSGQFIGVPNIDTPDKYGALVGGMALKERKDLASRWQEWWRRSREEIPVFYSEACAAIEFAGKFNLNKCVPLIKIAHSNRLVTPEITAASVIGLGYLNKDENKKLLEIVKGALSGSHAVIRVAGIKTAIELGIREVSDDVESLLGETEMDEAVKIEALKYVRQMRLSGHLQEIAPFISSSNKSLVWEAACTLADLTDKYFGEDRLKDPKVYASRLVAQAKAVREALQKKWENYLKK